MLNIPGGLEGKRGIDVLDFNMFQWVTYRLHAFAVVLQNLTLPRMMIFFTYFIPGTFPLNQGFVFGSY